MLQFHIRKINHYALRAIININIAGYIFKPTFHVGYLYLIKTTPSFHTFFNKPLKEWARLVNHMEISNGARWNIPSKSPRDLIMELQRNEKI
jgi:hypothetical protein